MVVRVGISSSNFDSLGGNLFEVRWNSSDSC